MKSVMKKDADIHTLIVTDPKPRPRRGSQQFRTGQALTSQLHTASQPALQNTPSTCRFQRATGKGRAGTVWGTEASQDTTSPLAINISSLWTLCRSPANLQVQNVKISQLCKMKKSRFFVFLSIWLFQRLTPKLSSTGRRTRVLLCKVRGNADELFSSRSRRFKKNSRYRETPNSHKTLMLWMTEFPLPLEATPQQVPVHSCCCYSAVLYFHYKTAPFLSFLTPHTQECQSMEVSPFSITLRDMRLIHLCGPLRVITWLSSGNERGQRFYTFLSIYQ